MIVGSPERDDVAEVMSRPEFAYPRSIPERITDWIGDRIDDLFDRMPEIGSPSGPAPPLGGGIGSLLGWLLVIAAVAVVVVVIVIVIRRWVPRVRDSSTSATHVDTEHRRSASQWASDAERYEAKGEWKLAIRARFRELVRTLVDRSQVADLPGRTSGEMLADLTRTTPDATDSFHTAAMLFELPWYADVPTGEAESARFRRAAETVLAADVLEHVDAEPSVRVGRVEVHP